MSDQKADPSRGLTFDELIYEVDLDPHLDPSYQPKHAKRRGQ